MVWKEASEGVSFWGVIAATTFLLAVRFPANERVTVSSVWLHAAPALFALGFGARAFAQEIENGTWELLRSVGASSRDVWGSKLLVGAGGSLLLAGQSSLLAMSWTHPFLIKQLGVQTFWFAAIV